MYKKASYHHARGHELMNDLLEKEAGKIPSNLLSNAERKTGTILGSKAPHNTRGVNPAGLVGPKPHIDYLRKELMSMQSGMYRRYR